jgi:hypothetical protein
MRSSCFGRPEIGHSTGLDAQVIAIGPFSHSVLPSMEYPANYYAEVAAGQIVVTNVFVVTTSSASHELASAFGVGAMELGRHHLDAQCVNIEKLKSLVGDVDKFLC